MDKWERDICAFRKMAEKYPQESYVAVAYALQLKWIFLQRVTKNEVQAFTGWKSFYGKPFCLVFSSKNCKTLHPIVGALSILPVNKSDLVLQNLVIPAKEK